MKATIAKIVNYIVQTTDPQSVLLFGSVADGTSNVHSDIDLLIVVERSEVKEFVEEKTQSYIRELGMNSDILVYLETEIEQASLQPESFLGSVVKNAKILYKKR